MNKEAFIQDARRCGIEEQIAQAAYDELEPWATGREILLATRWYQDLGIAEEDLEDVVFAIWRKVFGWHIHEAEAGAFPRIDTVGDVLLHIAHCRGGQTSSAF